MICGSFFSNEAGEITNTVDSNGNEIQYRYNSFGLMREIVDQEGLKEALFYDGERNLMLQIDRNGTRTERHYTVDGAITFERATTKAGRTATNHYEYDIRGRLVKAVNDGFVYTYEYDVDGRLKEKRSGGKLLLTYEYNSAGQMMFMKDGTGKEVRYEYDQLGRISRVLDGDGRSVASYTYEADDRIAEIAYGGGRSTSGPDGVKHVITRYLYDADGNISRLTTEVAGESLFDFRYEYEGNGNQVKKTGSLPSLHVERYAAIGTNDRSF